MNKNELREAFSKVQASDGLMQAVLLTEEKQKPRTNPWRTARRVAVCALLVVALLFGFFDYRSAPYFTIRVYASETDSVTLSPKDATIFVPVLDMSQIKNDPSYRPEFDSTLGSNWEAASIFLLSVYLNDETKDYEQINVFVDGRLLGPNSTDGFVGYMFKDGEIGRFIRLDVNKNTRLDIVFCDENGKELQHYGVRIEPAEGGWNVTLDEAYVSVWRSGLFSGLR